MAPPVLPKPHAVSGDEALAALQSSLHGLSRMEAAARLEHYGRNALPQPEPPGIFRVFLRQFASPLIYVLVAAALVSVMIREWSDAGFIAAVLRVQPVSFDHWLELLGLALIILVAMELHKAFRGGWARSR